MSLRNCAQYALTHYFSEINEFHISHNIKNNYLESQYVGKEGSLSLSLLPLLVEELSNGNYTAKISIKEGLLPEEAIKKQEDISDLLDKPVDKILKWQEEGRKNFEYVQEIEYEFPSILFLYKPEKQNSGHIIFVANRTFYQNNQWRERCINFPYDLPGEVLAKIKIVKTS